MVQKSELGKSKDKIEEEHMLENHRIRVESIKNRGNVWSKLSGHEDPTFP